MKTAYYFNRYQDNEEIVILDSSNFGLKNLCDCYDRYGQTVGCYNAGCYSFDNSECDIAEDFYEKDFLDAFSNKNEEGESIWGLKREELEMSYKDFCNMLVDDKEEFISTFEISEELYTSIISFFQEWKSENENHTESGEVFEYHNGSNWQTLCLNGDDASTDALEEVEETESKKIVAAYERATFTDKGFGKSEYVGRKYKFTKSQFASDPFITHVEIF